MEISLTRKEIIEKKYKWREGLIPLTLSLHAKKRAQERIDGEFPIIPTMVRITKDNICSGKAKNRKRLSSVKVRLEYSKTKWIYLVICPNSGIVKTLYINYKDAKKNTFKKKNHFVEECCEEEDLNKDVGLLSEPVAKTTKRKTLLELWCENIRRKFFSILGPFVRKRTGEV